MWGDTGVSTSARSSGSRIGPRAENEYAVEPVGVRHDEPVGGVGREELAVEVHAEAHGVAHRRLLEHRLVEGVGRDAGERAVALDARR